MNRILDAITKPLLLVHEQRARDNIEKMAKKARLSNVRFRPHFKTHQSAGIAEWFRDYGVTEITTSSVDMAGYFADSGWENITVAFSVNIREIDKINEIASRINLGLLVESTETVAFLDENLTVDVDVWIKIDVGYHRTGVPWDNPKEVLKLANQISSSKILKFKGLLTHAGHSYSARSRSELREIYAETIRILTTLKGVLLEFGIESVELSFGDTPCCSVVENFSALDEIRPGNFVFYDLMQLQIGSCTEEQIALAVACPVVARHASRNEVVIYGGAVHLSKESLNDAEKRRIFGRVVPWHEEGWGPIIPDAYVSSLSQEHGIVRCPEGFFKKITVGDILFLLPVHSCLTVNLIRNMIAMNGETVNQ